MSLMTVAYLMEKYGPLMTTREVAEVLKIDAGTLRNQRSSGEFTLEGKKKGRDMLYHAEDVAKFLDTYKQAA